MEPSIGPAPAVVGYQTTVLSTRCCSGCTADCLVIVIVRTPASNGPRSRTSEHVPAVQSTTSAQWVCSSHAVWSYFGRSWHPDWAFTRHDTGTVPVGCTRPHGTRADPQLAPLMRSFTVFSHSARSVLPATAEPSRVFAQRRHLPRLAAVSHGHTVSVSVRSVAMAR